MGKSTASHLRAQRNYKLRKRGWTPEQYEVELKAQDEKCAICRQPMSRRKLDGDHNHRTGQRRGILCNGCNLMLGFADDDPKILDAAAAYLRKYEKDSTA